MHTDKIANVRTATIVRVSTAGRDWPEQDRFLSWLDQWCEAKLIKNDSDLARRAGFSHTVLSAIRQKPRPKQIPRIETLSKIADVLGRPRAEAWAAAGQLPPEDQPTVAAVDWYEQMVQTSKLPKKTKDQLIARRRSELEAERRRLVEQIKLMEELQSH